MTYYRWMIEWRNANGSGNAFVVGSSEKEARFQSDLAGWMADKAEAVMSGVYEDQ